MSETSKPYVPQVGHRVRYTEIREGVVTSRTTHEAWVGGQIFPLSCDRNDVTVAWERLPEAEPTWQPGDMVLDADGDMFTRVDHPVGASDALVWKDQHGRYVEKYAVRPLRRLVVEPYEGTP